MSTQIDPLTGLPMVFDNIIEQIPLDAQIFPYADLGATARPTAPPLYPDSIIPVSAFLSGQHPDTGSAQTVATNGDHDLRVHLTNLPSPGGAAKLPVDAFQNWNTFTNVGPAGSPTFANTYNMTNTLYGYSLGFFYTQAAVADVSPLRIYVESQLTGDDIYLWEGFAHWFDGTAYKPSLIDEVFFYPEPIDLTTATDGNPTSFDLHFRGASLDFTCVLKLFAI